ncbi:STAS domain-containing protein [Nocardioides pantholopis]|uniref:STAS domain-containing protein n=1 Tax=Nocardioides pantholopis TaxID=2483798 RepID=UPI000F07D0FB|nr:STAS domain-containing protein [Nocardioides pantholopis]
MQERPFSSTFHESTGTLRVVGAVDEVARSAFSSDLAVAAGQVSDVLVVDLTDVDYFPSVAVSVLVDLMRNDAGAGKVELVAGQGTIAQRVLQLCGLPHRTA